MENLKRFQLPIGLAMLVAGLASQAAFTGTMLKLGQTALVCGIYAILSYDLRGRHFPPDATGRRAVLRAYLFPREEAAIGRRVPDLERSANGYTMADVNKVLSPGFDRIGPAVTLGMFLFVIALIWFRQEPPRPDGIPPIPVVAAPTTGGAPGPVAGPRDGSP